jgi:hypothetical protein
MVPPSVQGGYMVPPSVQELQGGYMAHPLSVHRGYMVPPSVQRGYIQVF